MRMTELVYFLLALLVTAGITYLIRLLPLLFVRKKIKNPYLKSFLYYVPYVVLSLLAFPAIIFSVEHVVSGVAAALSCAFLAYKKRGLIVCMVGSVLAALICEIVFLFI
jgi:branched-subunit amino acid transport protein